MVEMNPMTTLMNMRWKLIYEETGAENAEIHWRFRVGDQVKIRLLKTRLPEIIRCTTRSMSMAPARFLVFF